VFLIYAMLSLYELRSRKKREPAAVLARLEAELLE
jgi:hypothetical protein